MNYHMLSYRNEEGNYLVPQDAHGGVCVDIGANEGNFTKRVVSVFSVVHSYEPNPFLANKISEFAFLNNKVFNEAVGDRVSTTQLMMHSNRDSGSCAIKDTIESVIRTKDDWTNTIVSDISMVDIEIVLSRVGGKIDYLKMDCENSESLILLGKDLSEIRYIGVELHNQMGEQKWNQLKEWVDRTHSGFPAYNGQHIETLLTRK